MNLPQDPQFYKGKNYSLYFLTPHWRELKHKYIYSNPAAKCWICEMPVDVWQIGTKIMSNLLLHHEIYDNLFGERLLRDIFILCEKCHKQLHFWWLFGVKEMKTKMTIHARKKRRLFLRLVFCIRYKRIRLIPWYLLRYSLCL